MDYMRISLSVSPDEDYAYDSVFSILADCGFESFDEVDGVHYAYCPVNRYNKSSLDSLPERLPLPDLKVSYKEELVADKDWNETWESENFTPISVDGRVYIHAPNQKGGGTDYDIVIDPKMSFGTGHHATTCMMISFILNENLSGKSVLDMGCGTAVLAILASKRNAGHILAVDIDEWAYNNAVANAEINGCDNISVELGSADVLNGRKFDIVFANINRNILLDGMKSYASSLLSGGVLLLSGFLEDDIPILLDCASQYGLSLSGIKKEGEWRALKLVKC